MIDSYSVIHSMNHNSKNIITSGDDFESYIVLIFFFQEASADWQYYLQENIIQIYIHNISAKR